MTATDIDEWYFLCVGGMMINDLKIKDANLVLVFNHTDFASDFSCLYILTWHIFLIIVKKNKVLFYFEVKLISNF
jgi:hypothetical protein